jgi:hypothetical protein
MKQDCIILKKAVSEELCKFLALEFSMMETTCRHLYPDANLADLCDNTFARYSPLMMEALSVHLQPIVEETVEMKLYPVYSYARIYYEGSELKKHHDRESSEVTLSICLEKEEDWPLYIENHQGEVHVLNLDVGDVGIYSGRKHQHWREPLKGKRHIQAFLQYVDAEGESAWLKYETRACLGLPFEYVGQAVRNVLEQMADARKLFNR